MSHSEVSFAPSPPPVDKAQALTNKLVRWLAIAIFGISAIALLLTKLIDTPADVAVWAQAYLLVPLVVFVAMWGFGMRAAAWCLVAALWMAVTLAVIRYSGVSGLPFTANVLVICLAAVTLPKGRWLLVFGLCLLTGMVLTVAELDGLIRPKGLGPTAGYMPYVLQFLILVGCALAIYIANGQIRQTMRNLRAKNAELERNRRELERRSAENAATTARLKLESDQRRDSIERLSRAKNALRASEKRYRTVFEHDPNAVIVADLVTQEIKDANTSATNLFGYQHEVLVQLAMPDLSPPAQPQWIGEDADLLALDQATFHDLSMYEWVFEKSNGEQFPGEVRMVRLPSGEEEPQLYQMSIVDITERHYALRALQESEARYRTLVENAPDAILVLDFDKHCVVEANEKAAQLFGVSRVELLTAEIETILPLDSAEIQFETYDDVANATKDGGQVSLELLHKRPDESEVALEAHLVRLPAGSRNLLRASMFDVSRRYAAEAMVGAIPGTVGVFSLDGEILFGNVRFAQRFELPIAKLSGYSVRRLINTEQYKAILNELGDENGRREFVLDARTATDKAIKVKAAVSVIEYRERPAILMLIDNHVSALARGNSGVQIPANTVQEMQQEIGKLQNQATIALSKLPLNDVARPHVEKALQAARRFSQISRDVVGNPKTLSVDVQTLNINELIEQSQTLFGLTIPSHLSILFALDAQRPQVFADSDLVKRMVAGMVINAADAIGEEPGLVVVKTGNVVISAETQAPYIVYTGTLLQPGLYTSITVQDNGNGYSSSSLRHTFDPELSPRGVRLAAIVRVVRGHRGGMRVLSEEGRGSAFEVILPTVSDPLTESNSQSVQTENPQAGRRVRGSISQR